MFLPKIFSAFSFTVFNILWLTVKRANFTKPCVFCEGQNCPCFDGISLMNGYQNKLLIFIDLHNVTTHTWVYIPLWTQRKNVCIIALSFPIISDTCFVSFQGIMPGNVLPAFDVSCEICQVDIIINTKSGSSDSPERYLVTCIFPRNRSIILV